ncbi:MAG: hypothetical protein J3Q66DRAFT_333842, partial [Benniella sp.]
FFFFFFFCGVGPSRLTSITLSLPSFLPASTSLPVSPCLPPSLVPCSSQPSRISSPLSFLLQGPSPNEQRPRLRLRS